MTNHENFNALTAKLILRKFVRLYDILYFRLLEKNFW